MADPTWRIIYSDFFKFDSTEGTPDDAPAYGVFGVLQELKGGETELIMGSDWYYHLTSDGRWYGGDDYGVRERLRNRERFTGFLQGRWVSRETLNDLMFEAKNDQDFHNPIG